MCLNQLPNLALISRSQGATQRSVLQLQCKAVKVECAILRSRSYEVREVQPIVKEIENRKDSITYCSRKPRRNSYTTLLEPSIPSRHPALSFPPHPQPRLLPSPFVLSPFHFSRYLNPPPTDSSCKANCPQVSPWVRSRSVQDGTTPPCNQVQHTRNFRFAH